jgi:hypothetical protein
MMLALGTKVAFVEAAVETEGPSVSDELVFDRSSRLPHFCFRNSDKLELEALRTVAAVFGEDTLSTVSFVMVIMVK